MAFDVFEKTARRSGIPKVSEGCRPRAAASGGRPQAGLEVVEKLLTNIISRSGTAWRFGIRGLLGQDRVGELIGHGIHEHLVVALAIGDDCSSPPTDLPESCLAVGPDGGEIPGEGHQQDVVQAHDREGPVEHQPGGFGAGALVTPLGDAQAELAGAGVLLGPGNRRGGGWRDVVEVVDGEVDLSVAGACGLLVPGLHRLHGGNPAALPCPAHDLWVAAPPQVGRDEVMAQRAQADSLALDQDEPLLFGFLVAHARDATTPTAAARSGRRRPDGSARAAAWCAGRGPAARPSRTRPLRGAEAPGCRAGRPDRPRPRRYRPWPDRRDSRRAAWPRPGRAHQWPPPAQRGPLPAAPGGCEPGP